MANQDQQGRIDFDWLKRHYAELIKQHGGDYRGAGWPTLADQARRIEAISQLFDASKHFSVLDYGCGAGAIWSYLHHRDYQFEYTGFDFCKEALELAASYGIEGLTSRQPLSPARYDYVVSSGIFNLPPPGTPNVIWLRYILRTVQEFNKLSVRGFAFNALSSRIQKQEKGWFYANPEVFLEVCLRQYSKVALLHDYGLDDFTIIVRK